MPTEPQPAHDPESERLHRMELGLEELNARIARLAIGLGVSLDREDQVARVMQHVHEVHVPVERRSGPAERRTTVRPGAGPDRRRAHKLAELRGLLVLRYSVEKSYVDQVGVTATRQMLVEAEEHLARDGFKPGADGINLKTLLPRD